MLLIYTLTQQVDAGIFDYNEKDLKINLRALTRIIQQVITNADVYIRNIYINLNSSFLV